jgi:hypothetical protein
MEVAHGTTIVEIGPNLASVLIAVVSGVAAVVVAWLKREPVAPPAPERNEG